MKYIRFIIILLIFCSILYGATNKPFFWVEDPADGEVFVYDGDDGKWLNVSADSISFDTLQADSLYIAGNARVLGNIIINNSEWILSINAAGNDIVNVIRLNGSDELEIGAVLNTGITVYETDVGLIAPQYLPLSSDGSQGDENGAGVSIAGTVPIMAYGQNDGLGGADALGQKLSGNSVQTTDATATEIDVFLVPDDAIVRIRAIVIGTESDSSSVASEYELSGLFHNSGGSGATQIGTTISHSSTETVLNDTDCVFAVSGNEVQIKVTGIAAETWNWKCNIEHIMLD